MNKKSKTASLNNWNCIIFFLTISVIFLLRCFILVFYEIAKNNIDNFIVNSVLSAIN